MFEVTGTGPRGLRSLWYNSDKGPELVALFEPSWRDLADQLAQERNEERKSAAATTLTFDGTISGTRVEDGGREVIVEIDGSGTFGVRVHSSSAGQQAPEWFRRLVKDQPVNVRITFLDHEISKGVSGR
jgi:hypothetical protein